MIELNGCRHRFHKECIDEWFKKKLQCPLCMQCCGDQTVVHEPIANEMVLRRRTRANHRMSEMSPTSEAIDVLLQSPISTNCKIIFIVTEHVRTTECPKCLPRLRPLMFCCNHQSPQIVKLFLLSQNTCEPPNVRNVSHV